MVHKVHGEVADCVVGLRNELASTRAKLTAAKPAWRQQQQAEAAKQKATTAVACMRIAKITSAKAAHGISCRTETRACGKRRRAGRSYSALGRRRIGSGRQDRGRLLA